MRTKFIFIPVLVAVCFTSIFAQKEKPKQRLYVQNFVVNSENKDLAFLAQRVNTLIKVGLVGSRDIEVVDKKVFPGASSTDSATSNIRSLNNAVAGAVSSRERLDSLYDKNQIRFVLQGSITGYENKVVVNAFLSDRKEPANTQNIVSEYVSESELLIAFNSLCQQLGYYLDLYAYPDKARIGGAQVFRSANVTDDEFGTFLNQLSDGLNGLHAESYIIVNETSEDYSDCASNQEVLWKFKRETNASYLLGGEVSKDSQNVFNVKYYLFSKKENAVSVLPVNEKDAITNLATATLPSLKNWLNFFTSKDSTRSVRILEKITDVDSLMLVYYAISDSNYWQRLYVLSQAAAQYPGNSKILYEQGLLEFNAGKYSNALVYLKKVSELPALTQTERSTAMRTLALTHEQMYEYAQSIELYRSLLLDRNSDSTLYDIGRDYYFLARDDSATYYLRKYLQHAQNKTKASDAFLLLGNICTTGMSFNPDSAIYYYDKAMQLDRNNLDARINYANYYTSMGMDQLEAKDYQEAMKSYTKANNAYKTRSGYDGLKELYYLNREFAKADSLLESGLADSIYSETIFEDNAYRLRGMAQQEKKDGLYDKAYMSEAINYFKKVKKLKPAEGTLENLIGISYEDCREYDSAIVHYQTAILLEPEQPHYYLNLAETQILAFKAADAIKTLAGLSRQQKALAPNLVIYYYLKIVASKLSNIDTKEDEQALAELFKSQEHISSRWDFTTFINWAEDSRITMLKSARAEIKDLTKEVKRKLSKI